MSVMTLTPANSAPEPINPVTYAAGRADAHDDHTTGTSVDILRTRLDWLIDEHPSTGYVIGYSAVIADLTHAAAIDRVTETALAYLDEAISL